MSYNSYRGIEIASINLGEAFTNLATLADDGPEALNEYERRACRRLFVQAISVVTEFMNAANNDHFKVKLSDIESLQSLLNEFAEDNAEVNETENKDE
jgi:hypothetical protein